MLMLGPESSWMFRTVGDGALVPKQLLAVHYQGVIRRARYGRRPAWPDLPLTAMLAGEELAVAHTSPLKPNWGNSHETGTTPGA
jgi:hypothetical protein